MYNVLSRASLQEKFNNRSGLVKVGWILKMGEMLSNTVKWVVKFVQKWNLNFLLAIRHGGAGNLSEKEIPNSSGKSF